MSKSDKMNNVNGMTHKNIQDTDKMAIVSAEKFVQAARDNGYAVGGFNTNNLEWTQAILHDRS